VDKKILIIGAGPCGLGAAYRLNELGHTDWKLYERNPSAGGLSRSARDDKGFIWDIGGHVLFSHYAYFDALFEKLLADGYIVHKRSSWIRIFSGFVPYPFQNNLNFLPPDAAAECIAGLAEAKREPRTPSNFKDWILSTFGHGISRHFMLPYNRKVWAHPLEDMAISWVSERVSMVDMKKAVASMSKNTKEVEWGAKQSIQVPIEWRHWRLLREDRSFDQR